MGTCKFCRSTRKPVRVFDDIEELIGGEFVKVIHVLWPQKYADELVDRFQQTLQTGKPCFDAERIEGRLDRKLANCDAAVIEEVHTMMERRLKLMVRLMDDLLDVGRISRGKVKLKKERVELPKVVQQAVENSRPLIDQASHTLLVSVPPDPIYVDADITRWLRCSLIF